MTDDDKQPETAATGTPADGNSDQNTAPDAWPWAHVLGFDTAKEWGLDSVIPHPSAATSMPDPTKQASDTGSSDQLGGLGGHSPLQGQNLIEYAMQQIEQALGQPMQPVPPLSSYAYGEDGSLITTAGNVIPRPSPAATPETPPLNAGARTQAPPAPASGPSNTPGTSSPSGTTDTATVPNDGEGTDATPAPSEGDPSPSMPSPPQSSPTTSSSSSSSSTANTSTSEPGPQSYRIDLTRDDGRNTCLEGTVTYGDLYRPLLPELSGNAKDAKAPDWLITLDHQPSPAPTNADTDTIVTALLKADEIPADIQQWSLSVGPQNINTARLALNIPADSPSFTRASIIGNLPTAEWHIAASTLAASDAEPSPDDEPLAPASLCMDQHFGSPDTSQAPFVATMQITSGIANASVSLPVQLRYCGTLPSPILQGDIPLTKQASLSFRMQITPPADDKDGACLIALILRDDTPDFSVTAQLRGNQKISTPTAMLGCNDPAQGTECRAESMIANATTSLQTNLICIPKTQAYVSLATYGFVLPAEPASSDASDMPDTADTPNTDANNDTASSATPSKSASAKPSTSPVAASKGKGKSASSSNDDSSTTAKSSAQKASPSAASGDSGKADTPNKDKGES